MDTKELAPTGGAVSDAPTPDEARAEMVKYGVRGYFKVRHVLVQNPEDPRPSIVGRMVTERRHRALVLNLLLLTCWPWLEESREPLAADVWIRALTADDVTKSLTWSESTLSRAWRDLEALGLIEKRERAGRLLKVRPRREDGGEPYTKPAGQRDRLNKYFTIPDIFWTEKYFARLTLPGLAMLLVIAKETSNDPEMWMTYDRAKGWYGISAKSAQNGIDNLESLGLVHKRIESVKAPLSKSGWTTRTWYSLTGDFGHEARKAAQKRAADSRSKRAGTADTSEG